MNLLKISGQCDGVRCDMAMLILPEVFESHLGDTLTAVLVTCNPAGTRKDSGLLFHGRGLLGPGMDPAAAGI